MSIERTVVEARRKPWGSRNLLPWSDIPASDDPIGELWFRPGAAASSSQAATSPARRRTCAPGSVSPMCPRIARCSRAQRTQPLTAVAQLKS